MTEAIVDTDILSFYFKGDQKVIDRFREYLKEFDQINIAIVTYYETIAGLKFKKAEKQLRDFAEFIGTSDILIAGIAIENGLTLITNNEKHYEPIQGLTIENWKK